MRRRVNEKGLLFSGLALSSAILMLVFACPPSLAETPREAVSNELMNMDQTLPPLMEAIARCLQEQGMWPPTGANAQMCGQLQQFRKNLASVEQDNEKRVPHMLVRNKMQFLAQAATMIERWLMSIQPTEDVTKKWGETKAAFIKANRALNAGAGSPGWERYYDSDVPDSSYHRGEGLKYYLGITQRKNIELCAQVQAYLQSKGRWSPQGNDMELCMALSMLTKQLAKLAAGELDGCDPEPQIVEIAANRKNIEKLVAMTGLSQVAAKDWFEVRTGLTDIVQAFCIQCPDAKQLGLEKDEETAPAAPPAGQTPAQAGNQPGDKSESQPAAQPAPEDAQF